MKAYNRSNLRQSFKPVAPTPLKKLRRQCRTYGSFCIGLFLAATLQAEITASASFNPARIALGDRAQYIIEIVETSPDQMPTQETIPSLPLNVPRGLELRNGRPSVERQVHSINFSTEYRLTYKLVFDAVPADIKTYQTPGFRFNYKGTNLSVNAASLTAVERPADAVPAIDALMYLRLDAPEKLYIGQTTRVSLKLYIHEQVNYRGYDNFNRNADAFTVSDLTDPTETTEIVEGHRYRVLQWPITITPIQSGPQDLNFEFSVVAQVPSNNNRRAPFGQNSPFGNSVFDQFFSQPERFNLYTQPTQIDVRPLPTAGQPSGFSGAIGDFGMQVYADAETTRQGEPIMLSVKITGRGNFERINGPTFPESTDWRSYSPETILDPTPSDPLRAIKRFDYIFIPQKSGSLALPEVSFSYFDPETREYIELSAPPIPIEVAPSLIPPTQTLPPAKPVTPAASIDATPTLNPESAWLTLDYRPNPSRSTGLSILQHPLFYTLNALALLAFAISERYIRKRRKLQSNANFALLHTTKKELKAARATAQIAENQNDPAGFYRSAQDAVRLAATHKTGRNLKTAELPDLEAVFKQLQLSQQSVDAARTLFQSADALRFSGRNTTADLKAAREQLNLILKAL